MDSARQAVIDIRHLQVDFPNRHATLTALSDINLAIYPGEILGVVGESGAGKSMTGLAILGLLEKPGHIAAGEIWLGTRRIDQLDERQMEKIRGREIGAIFQDPLTSLNPLFTVGQRQRISIARALASEPEFLVCDEPTSALDVSVQAQILNLMRQLQDRLGLTYLFISHDLSVVRHMADHVAVMYLGRIVEQGATEEIFQHCRHPYTQLLLQTIPNIHAPNRQREATAGEVPSPLQPPSGCSFHPRCPVAVARCSTQVPSERTLASGARIACHLVQA